MFLHGLACSRTNNLTRLASTKTAICKRMFFPCIWVIWAAITKVTPTITQCSLSHRLAMQEGILNPLRKGSYWGTTRRWPTKLHRVTHPKIGKRWTQIKMRRRKEWDRERRASLYLVELIKPARARMWQGRKLLSHLIITQFTILLCRHSLINRTQRKDNKIFLKCNKQSNNNSCITNSWTKCKIWHKLPRNFQILQSKCVQAAPGISPTTSNNLFHKANQVLTKQLVPKPWVLANSPSLKVIVWVWTTIQIPTLRFKINNNNNRRQTPSSGIQIHLTSMGLNQSQRSRSTKFNKRK